MIKKILILLTLLCLTNYAFSMQCLSTDSFFHKKGFDWTLKADLAKNHWSMVSRDENRDAAIESDLSQIPESADLEVIKNDLNVVFCQYTFGNVVLEVRNAASASSFGHVFEFSSGYFPCHTTAGTAEKCSWTISGPFLGSTCDG
jgi:hypothetical protein